MKRILSLDGGGIRGVFTLQILGRIEALFRQQANNPQLVLADVFDLIAGTSTGAIIATFLSWGMEVRSIEHEYIAHGAEMFTRERWYRRWKAKYRADAIAHYFRRTFAEADGTPALFGSKRLRTLLLIVIRNASTGSPWPLSNNPKALFNLPSCPECNLRIPLWELLRASTAAPSFFPPQEITLEGRTDLVVDGGMTPYNNPALIAILMATLPGYRLQWPSNRRSLHVISVGTGVARAQLPRKLAKDINMLDQLKYLAPALIGATALEQDAICRILGDCLHGPPIDTEMGLLNEPTLFSAAEQKFTYVRYDCPLGSSELKGRSTLDNLQLIPWLQNEGKRYASTVQVEHLSPRG
ncbi:MAG: patatin-like phospholipase family protein [Verrucomicrobiota bacterium]